MIEPEVIFEDENVLAINKPVGWLVHGDGKTEAPTIVEWFLGRQPLAAGVGEPGFAQDGTELNRSGVVHRLDKETSGILILVKNQSTYDFLKKQFQKRKVKKEYQAIVYGKFTDQIWGTINRPIGRSSKDSRLRSAMKGARGNLREAITDYEVVKTGEYKGESFSYLKLFPKTGRTHQLRVHLRAIDRPIVGDELYSSHLLKNSNNLDLNRLALHAHKLELALPLLDQIKLTAPLPGSLEEATGRILSTE